MDRTVPIAAARMLDFIRATEVGTDGPSGYQVIYGFNQDKLPTPITQMTIDAVIAAQASFTKRFGSSATGGYQFMRATLKDLKRELGLRGTQVLDPDLQDRLGYHLLKRRGYEAFMAGRMSREDALLMFVQAARGIQAIHDHSLVHFDLKPANIMIGEFGEVMVMDWGIARLMDGKEEEIDDLVTEGLPTLMRKAMDLAIASQKQPK